MVSCRKNRRFVSAIRAKWCSCACSGWRWLLQIVLLNQLRFMREQRNVLHYEDLFVWVLLPVAWFRVCHPDRTLAAKPRCTFAEPCTWLRKIDRHSAVKWRFTHTQHELCSHAQNALHDKSQFSQRSPVLRSIVRRCVLRAQLEFLRSCRIK